MLQKQININYADMRSDKSKAGDLFIIQIDKPRIDNVKRLQPIEVEVEEEVVYKEKWDAEYCERVIEKSFFTFCFFCITMLIVGIFYLYTTAAIKITTVVLIALFINRAVRLRLHRRNT